MWCYSTDCFIVFKEKSDPTKIIQLTFRYLSWGRWMLVKIKGNMQRHRNLTFLCQNLAVMYPSLHYLLFLLIPSLEYWHRNCLRDPALSKWVSPSYLWTTESPTSLERLWPNPATHSNLHLAVPHFPLLIPWYSIFSCSPPEPEVAQCLTGDRLPVLSQLIL